MIKVCGVRFKKSGKMYYFDPDEIEIEAGDNVIVETARGLEFGMVTLGNTELNESNIVKPLKKVIRIANEEDKQRHDENEKKKGEAMRVCKDLIIKHELDMKLIDIEYTFDNNKIIFYFTSDGRVDFRELVKDLAAVFHMRIELRQVGVRDEAKMLGGIGCCGREVCCASWLSDFQPVSIKMTKVQNLSLNPTKISGVCGRLMCCLKYENDVYLELSKSVPKLNEKVESKEGLGKVIESNVLAGKIKVRIFTGEKDENGRDKLGSDIYTFDKNDVRRINKPNIQEKIEKKETEETDFEPELEDAQIMDILESEEKNFEKDLSLLPDFQIDEFEVGKNEEVPSEENASNENKPKRSRHRRPRRRSGSAPKSGERRDSAKQGAERKERSKDHVSNQQRNRNSRRPRKPAKQADKGNGNADKA